jgi:alanine racemase
VTTSRSEGVGNGEARHAAPGRRLATVAVGFKAGLLDAAEPAVALCRGRCAETVGALGMDSLQLDVTAIDDVAVGDWVTLVGDDGTQSLPLASVAAASGSSPYHLLARLRLARAYRPAGPSRQETLL